ncbi:hypothetical protein CC78DRAFT_535904 [Lojkania enalia]|uniref:Uncharacterized protein n=1 Tax=Lojkania enalia TaxID=147567 RepID=A0A9P4N123_9PLEO|nr:hypothetical protein CC78DRAFT_535904 [Didymosphaeria enalia]
MPPPPTPGPKAHFDEIFSKEFWQMVQEYRKSPDSSPITAKDRKILIDRAYAITDERYFGGRLLSDQELKLRALTKVFVKIIADEPWSEDWIRPHDVERKLSRFEMHKDSVELAAQHGLHTPRDAIAAARRAQVAAASHTGPGHFPRGPFDDIEIIYIPGTVSSTATNRINRDDIYPVSVASVANVLQTHICRDLTKPFQMAEKFVTLSDTAELIKMRDFACSVCDFAPHLLDNDNLSLLLVLLIIPRSEVCKRFENNGIRIEGSTISHRRAECMKQKLGWKTSEDRKPFDNTANEFQTRIKNAVNPPIRGAPRSSRSRVSNSASRRASSSSTPAPSTTTPPIGYYSAPQVQNAAISPAEASGSAGNDERMMFAKNGVSLELSKFTTWDPSHSQFHTLNPHFSTHPKNNPEAVKRILERGKLAAHASGYGEVATGSMFYEPSAQSPSSGNKNSKKADSVSTSTVNNKCMSPGDSRAPCSPITNGKRNTRSRKSGVSSSGTEPMDLS